MVRDLVAHRPPDLGLSYNSVDEVAKLAEVMLRDPRATVGVGAFYRWWLRPEELRVLYEKNAAMQQLLKPAHLEALMDESWRFSTWVTLETKTSTLRDLLTMPVVMVNDLTAPLYGLTSVRGSALTPRTRPR